MSEQEPVSGIAIRAGLSRNGIIYEAEELEKFAPTLANRPILKDHISATDNTIGVVTDSKSIDRGESVGFSGWVKEDGTGIVEKIRDGRIKEVSIGAMVEKLVMKEEDADNPDAPLIAKGITAMELSTTPTPGVVGTSIKQSLKSLNEAKTTKEKAKVKPIYEDVSKIVLEKKESKNEVKETVEEKTEASKEVKEESKMDKENIQKEAAAEEVASKVEEKVKEEVDKKMSEEKLKEMEKTLESKDSEISESKAALEKKEAKIAEMEAELKKVAEEKRTALESKYKSLCESRKVKGRDVSDLSEETLSVLVEQLEEVEEPKEEEKAEEKPEEKSEEKPKEEDKVKEPETKGEVGGEEKPAEDVAEESLMLEEMGSNKYAIFRETYDGSKFKRLAR